jgi:hypothetical protein
MRGMFASRRGSLSAPVIKHGKFVLSALSLAGKGTVVAEKRSSRYTLQVPFPHRLNSLYKIYRVILSMQASAAGYALCYYLETAVSQLNGRKFDRRQV